MLIEDAFKDLEDRFWEKNSSEGIIGNSEVQSNPAISNSVNSKSLLFRSNRSFPYTVYTLIFNPVILNLSTTECKKKLPSDQPRVRSVKQSRLSHATICLLLREPRFKGKQASCHLTKVL